MPPDPAPHPLVTAALEQYPLSACSLEFIWHNKKLTYRLVEESSGAAYLLRVPWPRIACSRTWRSAWAISSIICAPFAAGYGLPDDAELRRMIEAGLIYIILISATRHLPTGNFPYKETDYA